MTCIKILNVEAAVQTSGKDVVVMATVDHVIPTEHGNVNLDKFTNRFLSVGKSCG